MRETYRCYEIISKMYGEVKKDLEQYMYSTCIIDLKEEEEHVYIWLIYS